MTTTNLDEEMSMFIKATPDHVVDIKAKEKTLRKAAVLVGVMLLLIVAASTTMFRGMPTGQTGLFDRRLKGGSGGDTGSTGGGDTGSTGNTGGSTGGGSSGTQTYTAADVQAHTSANDCWTIISNKVYDLTTFVNKHTGGPGSITGVCGKDGTSSYQAMHGTTLKSQLGAYLKGDLSTSTGNTGGSTGGDSSGTQTYTAADIQAHASASDCWTIISNKVYDLTTFVNKHTGGPGSITGVCGKDGTSSYQAMHGTTLKSELGAYLKGDLV